MQAAMTSADIALWRSPKSFPLFVSIGGATQQQPQSQIRLYHLRPRPGLYWPRISTVVIGKFLHTINLYQSVVTASVALKHSVVF
jgi:hypothetical protein